MIIDPAILKKLGTLLVFELSKELIDQGHKDTGDLISSIESDVKIQPNAASLLILMEEYGLAVDQGRKAGETRVPIQVLIDWVERKGIESGDREIKNAAYAIRESIFKNGIPTPGSNQFSKTGKRTDFIDETLQRNESFIFAEIEANAAGVVDAFLDTIVQQANAT